MNRNNIPLKLFYKLCILLYKTIGVKNMNKIVNKVTEVGRLYQMNLAIQKLYPWGVIDNIEIETSGLIRINGWTKEDTLNNLKQLQLCANEEVMPLIGSYRTYRADVADNLKVEDLFLGFTLEYYFKNANQNEQLIKSITIEFENQKIFILNESIQIQTPHYDNLFIQKEVMHRDNIYTYGLPVRYVNPEILTLFKNLVDPIIDFGCGAGFLVKELRSR
jgi:hypothetical protein